MKQIVVALSALIAFAFQNADAQAQKIGYVNSTKIFQELPEAQEAQRRIDGMTRPFQDSLAAMEKDLTTKIEEYQKKEALMNDAAKKAAQQEFADLRRRYEEFRVEKFGNDGELAKQTDRIINPLKEKILKAIEQVAKQEKYTFVFDQTDQVRVLLYGDTKEDLTNRVIDKLKRGK
ncbi:MAG TPA: OmpH family outer membrane protein [Bacteroidota bacterium]|nr:OmpH family outer membrane protein [Bacteroidota bacterium]